MRRLSLLSFLLVVLCVRTMGAQSPNAALRQDGEKRASDAIATTAPAPANAPQASTKTDISGTWAFQVETPAGAGTPTFTFKQDGEKLTGQYKGAFGEAPLTGTVKENKVDFVIKVEAQGQQMTITYTGTVEKDGTMKGTAELGEVGSATWTAKRQ